MSIVLTTSIAAVTFLATLVTISVKLSPVALAILLDTESVNTCALLTIGLSTAITTSVELTTMLVILSLLFNILTAMPVCSCVANSSTREENILSLDTVLSASLTTVLSVSVISASLVLTLRTSPFPVPI